MDHGEVLMGRIAVCLVVTGAILVTACSSEGDDSDKYIANHSTMQIAQLFLKWACPANAGIAEAHYGPINIYPINPQDKLWHIETRQGSFKVEDLTRVITPTTDETLNYAKILRAQNSCS